MLQGESRSGSVEHLIERGASLDVVDAAVELITMKNYAYLILTREQKKCIQLSCSFELLRVEAVDVRIQKNLWRMAQNTMHPSVHGSRTYSRRDGSTCGSGECEDTHSSKTRSVHDTWNCKPPCRMINARA